MAGWVSPKYALPTSIRHQRVYFCKGSSSYRVERRTFYHLIKLGRISVINIGIGLTRIKHSEMGRLFLNRQESMAEKEKPVPKT